MRTQISMIAAPAAAMTRMDDAWVGSIDIAIKKAQDRLLLNHVICVNMGAHRRASSAHTVESTLAIPLIPISSGALTRTGQHCSAKRSLPPGCPQGGKSGQEKPLPLN